MKEYTKTIRVQAVQWTGENSAAIQNHPLFKGKTIEGPVWATDWVCRDMGSGKVFAVRDADFTRDYKEVSE